MTGYHRPSAIRRSILSISLGSLLYGCAAGPDRANSGDQPFNSQSAGQAPPMALVDGRPIEQAAVVASMIELAGVEALTEVVLDHILELRANREDIAITAGDIEREQELLARTLSPRPNESARLLSEMRERQGLGDYRFNRLLRRNALLRQLVMPRVVVTEADARLTYELRYGERRQSRIIVVSTATEAEAVLDELDSGNEFVDVAARRSTDSSAGRGGLLEPIARADPTYPATVREALWSLEPGARSGPLLLRGGFAIVELVAIVPASDLKFADVRSEMFQAATLQMERRLMQELARDLLEAANVTMLDPALAREWAQRAGR